MDKLKMCRDGIIKEINRDSALIYRRNGEVTVVKLSAGDRLAYGTDNTATAQARVDAGLLV